MQQCVIMRMRLAVAGQSWDGELTGRMMKCLMVDQNILVTMSAPKWQTDLTEGSQEWVQCSLFGTEPSSTPYFLTHQHSAPSIPATATKSAPNVPSVPHNQSPKLSLKRSRTRKQQKIQVAKVVSSPPTKTNQLVFFNYQPNNSQTPPQSKPTPPPAVHFTLSSPSQPRHKSSVLCPTTLHSQITNPYQSSMLCRPSTQTTLLPPKDEEDKKPPSQSNPSPPQVVVTLKNAPKINKGRSTDFSSWVETPKQVPVTKSTLQPTAFPVKPPPQGETDKEDKVSVLACSGKLRAMDEVEEICSVGGSNDENSDGNESVVLARLLDVEGSFSPRLQLGSHMEHNFNSWGMLKKKGFQNSAIVDKTSSMHLQDL